MRADAVRVVLDRRDLAGNVELVALEVDDAVVALVTAAAPPRRELAAVVAAARSLERLDQRLVRLGRRDLVERLHALEPAARRRRLVVANRHDAILRSTRLRGTPAPSRRPCSRTQAFFQSGRWPTNRPCRLNLPCMICVRTDATFDPNSFSTARLMSIFVASRATSNTTTRRLSRAIVVFSVTSGRRMTSVIFIPAPPAAARPRRAWR